MRRKHARQFQRETFMKFRLSVLASLLALFTGTAFAHGNEVHVKGTIEKINADSVRVKTADGKSVEVKLAASTVYLVRSNNEDKPAKAADLAVGYLVVIHARSKDNALEASEIKFSVPIRTKAATSAPAKLKP